MNKITDLALPLEGMGLDVVLSDIDSYLKRCVRTNHPGFMNPLWGGFNVAAFAGEIIANLTNTSMYTYELAPMATLIEQALINRMCEIVGFADGNGVLTTGGSNGNMIGMMCARYKLDPIGQRRGYDGGDLVCFVSSESHYSVLMSANVLGIGYDNVIKVPCDNDGAMRVDLLREEIDRSRREGQTPFCVIATSGTTVRGAFDPIRDIASVCDSEDLWLHVDAAWGGSCLFSSKYRILMDGIEMADSICWDAHKMMGIPLICSAFLIKQPEILRRICSHGNVAHYLFLGESQDVDLGRISLQCGRRNDALKLFFAWREKGDAGWARLVESYVELAEYLEDLVVNNRQLELMSNRSWTNVCIRFTMEGINHDEVNSILRDRMMRSGRFMFSRSELDGQVILRPVIANPEVSKQSLQDLISEIISTGNDIVNDLPERV
ncbi:MAG: pyridoxal-dependent decarboxylase [Candidatus Poseidoniaceae archaeon]|nr:pyridoxal-dependent decarboxylase [Candidatus Poseidoniaceae archaeon]